MTINKIDLLKQINKIEDQEVLGKIALLVEQAKTTINGLEAIAHQAIPNDLNIEELKKEQTYESKDLTAFMKDWDYEEWKDIDIEDAIKAID